MPALILHNSIEKIIYKGKMRGEIEMYVDDKGLTSDGFIELTEGLEELVEKLTGEKIMTPLHNALCEIRIDLMEFIDDQIGKQS